MIRIDERNDAERYRYREFLIGGADAHTKKSSARKDYTTVRFLKPFFRAP